jgi:hypothetical protein
MEENQERDRKRGRKKEGKKERKKKKKWGVGAGRLTREGDEEAKQEKPAQRSCAVEDEKKSGDRETKKARGGK